MPERLVSTTCLGNLNDPSYELLLRRKLGGVFEVDELLLDWDQADVCALVGVTELGRTVDVRLDTADGGRLADGDVLAIDHTGAVPVVVVVRLRGAEVYLVEVDRMDPIALAHACWEIGNMRFGRAYRAHVYAGAACFGPHAPGRRGRSALGGYP